MGKFKRVRGWVAMILAVGFIFVGVSSVCSAEDELSPWGVRVRFIGVIPDDDSTPITLIGGEAEVDSSATFDLDFLYFFNKNFAAELTLTFTRHDVEAKGTAVGDVDLGDVWLLPPALTFLYYFMPDGQFRPYVGAGLNYTVFFGEDEGPVADSIDYDNNVGYVLQAGFDWGLNDHWSINVDVKKLWLDTDVTVRALGLVVETEVDIDPLLIGMGLTYRF